MRVLLALCLIAAAALPARAHAFTAVNGTRLLGWCESDKAADQSACMGYLTGVGDILNDQTIFQGRACLPPTTTSADLRNLIVLFIRANRNLAESASGANLAALAMIEAYPCKDT